MPLPKPLLTYVKLVQPKFKVFLVENKDLGGLNYG
jgi:hypothetical protein